MTKSGSSYIDNLNSIQREAVQTTEGPVLILAGAGSGKTRVLTYRIAYLIGENHVSPRDILAMTFTNKAAGEMRERVKQLTDDRGLWIGTFHSIFARILRTEACRFGYTSNYVIYDSDDQEKLIKSIMIDSNVSPKQFSPRSVLSRISLAKNSLVAPDAFNRTVNGPFDELVARIYPEYQNRLRRNQAFDFDDLITIPIQLFETHPDVLDMYQSMFKYILVDEYQDTNRAQYLLIHYLAKTHKNLCVVGDDDQSIYSWRGADIRNILDFESDFPDCHVFRLEQNYRSTQNILAAASAVVAHNKGRKEKTLWSDGNEGEKVSILDVTDEQEEARHVARLIQEEVLRNKRSFQDFAVLYRTNAQSRALEDGLRRNGLSYVIVGGVRFYERKEVRDVLAYLKLILNPNDDISLKRIINFPARGIGETTISRVDTWARERGSPFFAALQRAGEIEGLQARAVTKLAAFHELIKRYIVLKDEVSPNELVHALVDETGLLLMYKEDTTTEAQTRADNIRELLAAVGEYVNRAEDATLAGFLEEVSLVTDVDGWDDEANAITLMTLHCAKGLEFPVVFITGLEEGLLPVYQNMDDPKDIEEERRLFYVGLTRAQEKVYLSLAERRSRFAEQTFRLPSRFLDELDPSVIERKHSPMRKWKSSFRTDKRLSKENDFDSHPDYESMSQEQPLLQPGIRIEHNRFGIGYIKKVEGLGMKQKVTVLFESGVEKKLLTQYARFTIL